MILVLYQVCVREEMCSLLRKRLRFLASGVGRRASGVRSTSFLAATGTWHDNRMKVHEEKIKTPMTKNSNLATYSTTAAVTISAS